MAKGCVSTIIDAPIAAAWAVAREFGRGGDWIPGVESIVVEGGGPGDQVGCVRAVKVNAELSIRETLLALSDVTHSMTYKVVPPEGSPFTALIGTLSLRPLTEGNRTFAELGFELIPVPGADLAPVAGHLEGDTYPAMLGALKAHIEKRG